MSTYVFIDGVYLRTDFDRQMQEFYGLVPQIEFDQLRIQYGAQRVYYYDAVDCTQANDESDDSYKKRMDAREEAHDYINSLLAFHVRDGHVRKSPKKKNREHKWVDVQLAVDAMEHAARGNVTHAAVLTGDLGFEPLLSDLVRLGVQTQLIYVSLHTARELMRAADHI